MIYSALVYVVGVRESQCDRTSAYQCSPLVFSILLKRTSNAFVRVQRDLNLLYCLETIDIVRMSAARACTCTVHVVSAAYRIVAIWGSSAPTQTGLSRQWAPAFRYLAHSAPNRLQAVYQTCILHCTPSIRSDSNAHMYHSIYIYKDRSR